MQGKFFFQNQYYLLKIFYNQPNHPGQLIQFGWNSGQRNARIFGLVRNIKRTLSGEKRNQQDQQILGICSLAWNLLTAHLPLEVIDEVSKAIADAELPTMSIPYGDNGELVWFYPQCIPILYFQMAMSCSCLQELYISMLQIVLQLKLTQSITMLRK